jgi:hypothetical protein
MDIKKDDLEKIVKSPFTEEQVEALNLFQNRLDVHPFTCRNDGDDAHILYEFEKEHEGKDYKEYLESERRKGVPHPEMSFKQTKLIATKEGWYCPVCDYRQDWAHRFMLEKPQIRYYQQNKIVTH